MDCSVADVLTDAMSLIGDPDGAISQEIQNDFATAYSELVAALNIIAAPEITREVYFTLPANTNIIFPSQLGVTDFAEPQQLWERSGVTTSNVTGMTDGTPLTVTCSVLPGATGTRVELNSILGVPAWVNRDWYITVTGANTFTLNGSIATGNDLSGVTSGSIQWSSEPFTPMTLIDERPLSAQPPSGGNIGSWRWLDNTIVFPIGATLPRQIFIEYLADDTAPASGPIGLCNGRELKFLSHATASHFAPKRQLIMAPTLSMAAYGPSGQPDGTGGLCRQLLVPILKQKNTLQRRSGLYRYRRGFVILVT